MDASERILERLSGAGYRITEARAAVVHYLACAREPETIRKIAKHVASDEVSVYRTIALLRKLGLVEVVYAERGGDRYALSLSHHHHIVCDRCGLIAHIPCDGSTAPRTLKNSHFPVITSHEVTYHGYCASCAR